MKRLAYFTVTFLLLPLGIAFSNEHEKSSGSKKAITGCLEQGQAGTYMLREASGKQVMVASGTEMLAKHVNHTVKLTGTYTSNKDAKAAGAEHTSDMKSKTFRVDNVEHVSDSCGTSSPPVHKAKPNQ